ncbi:heme-binding protein 1 isoform X1 [Penaeus vannamei]|uniref:heme-binding protein 1 isoform X1 n=2 Tax=Penaeus vannamei TaxID=6689 RepID=UPI00387F6807
MKPKGYQVKDTHFRNEILLKRTTKGISQSSFIPQRADITRRISRMRCFLVLTLFAAVASALPPSWVRSFLSRKQEEAKPSNVVEHEGYEERTYPARKWVCTGDTGDAEDEDDRDRAMFKRLYRYIRGNNDMQERLAMGAPVTTQVTMGEFSNAYEMCFYIGEDHQASPPAPNDQLVTIEDRPQITVFTRTVGGYMHDDEDWLTEAARLAQVVEAGGEAVSHDDMYWVGYDPPFKFWHRRNEVWLLKN